LQAIGLFSAQAAQDEEVRLDQAEDLGGVTPTKGSSGRGRGRGGARPTSRCSFQGGARRSAAGSGGGDAVDDDNDVEDDVQVEVETPLVWPKHKNTKQIQRTHHRLEAILMNFATTEWELGLSDATCRSNLKAALEQTTLLETCVFPELIDRNAEHVADWKLIQRFRSHFKAYMSAPTDEGLLVMGEVLVTMGVHLKRLKSILCPHLNQLRLQSCFLKVMSEDGIKQAIDSLNLTAALCPMKEAYEKLQKSTADDGPVFQEWVETTLAETSVKNHLRLMDMAATSRSSELAKAHKVFEDYQDVLERHPEFFSAGAIRRAGGMLCISSSILGRRVSPSDVDAAVKSLSSPKQHELVKAFTHYRSCKEYMLHAHTVVERNADDVIADKLLDEVIAWISDLHAEEDRFDIDFIAGKMAGLQHCLQRMCEALPTWSKVRLEERFQDISAAVSGIVSTILLAEFGFVRMVVSILIGPVRKVHDEFLGFSVGLFDSAEYTVTMKLLRGAALRAQGLGCRAAVVARLSEVLHLLQKIVPAALAKVFAASPTSTKP
jgi:hypothetical protein